MLCNIDRFGGASIEGHADGLSVLHEHTTAGGNARVLKLLSRPLNLSFVLFFRFVDVFKDF